MYLLLSELPKQVDYTDLFETSTSFVHRHSAVRGSLKVNLFFYTWYKIITLFFKSDFYKIEPKLCMKRIPSFGVRSLVYEKHFVSSNVVRDPLPMLYSEQDKY